MTRVTDLADVFGHSFEMAHPTESHFIELLASQHGIARVRQAIDIGLPRTRLNRMVLEGRLKRVSYGIVAAAGAPQSDAFAEMKGVLLGGYGLSEGITSAIAGPSAAWSWKLRSSRPIAIHVLSTRRVENEKGYIFHRSGRFPSSEVALVEGIPTTDPIRTFLDYCWMESSWRARKIFHRALRERLFTERDVLERIEAESRQGRHGLVLAREIISQTTPGAERARSGFEETVIGWIVDAGHPLPERNVMVRSIDGMFDWEVDLLYRQPPTAIEVSPWDTHSDPFTYRKDLRKRAELEALGYKVIVVASPEEKHSFLKALSQRLGA